VLLWYLPLSPHRTLAHETRAGWFAISTCAGTEVALSLLRVGLLWGVLVACSRWGEAKALHVGALEDGVVAGEGEVAPAPPPPADWSVWWRRGAIGFIFIVQTALQVELGVKGVLSPLDPQTVNKAAVQGLLCVLIMVCNVELFLAKRMIDSITAEEGVFSKVSHKHRLFSKTDIGRSVCDRCHLRVVEAICWNCASCNFDVCLSCLRRDLRKAVSRR
jgi:hypothetical protein